MRGQYYTRIGIIISERISGKVDVSTYIFQVNRTQILMKNLSIIYPLSKDIDKSHQLIS